MLNIFKSSKTIIEAKTLQQLLDEILTPRLERLGLTKATNYTWHEQTVKEIRHGFSYNLLKGAAGTFEWGANLDFLPIVRRDRIEYHKTAKKYIHHLFEWTDEYSSSFTGGQMNPGVTTHFGFKAAKKSIRTLIDNYEQKMIMWFDKAKTIESLIDIAERQISFDKYYGIHSPGPKYVLAFLYAKANRTDEAVKLFDTLDLRNFDNKVDLKEKVKLKLLVL